MPSFFEYLRNITYYLLFSTIAGMAAPSGKYKKYISLITGLVLLLLMIIPLRDFIGRGIPVTEWFSGLIPARETAEYAQPSTDYQQWSYSQINAAFEKQLFTQVESLLSREGYELNAAEFEYEEDFSKLTGMELEVNATPGGVLKNTPIIRIEPVVIGQKPSEGENEEENADIVKIKKLITDFYSPDAPHIHVILT